MSGRLTDYRVFWREFRQNFHTTGAVLPSGRALARALTRFVDGKPERPKRILEVGPGTGAVTTVLVERLGQHDRLDLVELNDRFVQRLGQRFEREPAFQAVGERCRVLHQSVEQVPADEPYDLLISGLPLNNFDVDLVERILETFGRLLRPGGTLSFFEYMAVRPARAVVSSRAERVRLQGIGQALGRLLSAGEIRRDWIWPNVPPAWVHHVEMRKN
jgi:phospholipid N-methyltransferase